MVEITNIKKIVKYGNSWCIPLTKELKKIGLKKGDTIYTIIASQIILVSPLDIHDMKPLLINIRDYNNLKLLIKKYENKTFETFLDEKIKEWLDKYGSFWKRPALKIKYQS